MVYEAIIKTFGKDWLDKQINFLEEGKWINKKMSNTSLSTKPGCYVLDKINSLLLKFEIIEGFKEWIRESKNEKDFENYLFELMVLEDLISKTDSLKLKVKNGHKIPEAFIEKDNFNFYVEMTKLKSIPNSIKNNVEKLFKKAREKFRDAQGIHFIGVFNMFDYLNGVEKALPEFEDLSRRIRLKFQYRGNQNVIALILVNFYIATSPDFQKSSVQKRYYVFTKPLDKGGKSNEFFKNILDVDRFIEV